MQIHQPQMITDDYSIRDNVREI